MKTKRTILAGITATAVAAVVASQANAAMIVPAKYASGPVTAVDQANNTLTLGGKTFVAEPARLKDLYAGNDVQILYFEQGGVLRAVWITVPERTMPEDFPAD